MRSCGFCCRSLNTQGVNQHVQLCADNCIPRGERTACVTVFQDPCHNGSHTQSLENSSPFLEDSMLLKHYAQSLSWLKWSTHPHKTMQCLSTFQCSLSVLAVVSVLWHSPSLGLCAGMHCDTAPALVFLLVSVCCDSPSLGVLDGVNVLWQPKPGSSCWCQMHCNTAQALVFMLVLMCCDTAQAWVFMLVSNALWHSPSLGVLAGVKCIATQPKPRQQRPMSKTTCRPGLLFSLTHP